MSFRSKNLLVTGGCGFIGSNFIDFILKKYNQVRVINIDKLTYAGSIDNTLNFNKNSRYELIVGDILDNKLVKEVFSKYLIDGVINFAAETHVDRSIISPKDFINTNINGVYNLLSISYERWFEAPHKLKSEYKNARFHQISTDEVFGSILENSFSENSPYKPNSPYSASKASADMLVRSFNRTYGLNVTTTICSNNFGPNQHNEKFLPKLINSLKDFTSFPLYGDGKNQRDWIHVDDHCSAIELIFNEAENGEKFNVGSGLSISNIQIIKMINSLTNRNIKLSFVEDRHGHDFRYSLNCSKIKEKFKWQPKIKFESYLRELVLN